MLYNFNILLKKILVGSCYILNFLNYVDDYESKFFYDCFCVFCQFKNNINKNNL